MAILVPNLAAPHKVVYVPFGSTATAVGTSAANGNYRMWCTDSTSEILSIQLCRLAGAVTCTYKAGSITANSASATLTALTAEAATTDNVTPGLLSLTLDSDPNDATKGTVVPPGTYIGFTAAGTVGAATITGVIIKYRSS